LIRHRSVGWATRGAPGTRLRSRRRAISSAGNWQKKGCHVIFAVCDLRTAHAAPIAQALAERLLDLQIEIEPALARIGELKEDLRAIAEERDEGFIEEIAGKGVVEVKAGREREFKGLLPELKPEAFLALPESRQQKLKEQA
jgi:hypothetical protein